jgi:hypothetical protein
VAVHRPPARHQLAGPARMNRLQRWLDSDEAFLPLMIVTILLALA